MLNKNDDLELLWKEINRHKQVLEKMLRALEELNAEIDKIKANYPERL